MTHNYKYNNDLDNDLINGISINRNLTIYGNGLTLMEAVWQEYLMYSIQHLMLMFIIYKYNVLYTTVYALTGEGWVVDLIPGNYTAELSLTDYPDENSTNVTINVLKGNTTLLLTLLILQK